MTDSRRQSFSDRIVADVRAISAASPDGRLPMPDLAEWDIFPFEGEMRVKELSEPTLPESAREGEAGAGTCSSCQREDDDFIWTDDNWRLKATSPSGLPATVLLLPRVHCDLTDLLNELAVEMGPLFLRIEAALLSLDGIARVHINRWGDGGAHLHWWFIARPEGLTELMGSCSSMWLDVLPPRPQDEWDDTMRQVASAMSAGDQCNAQTKWIRVWGRSAFVCVEPPEVEEVETWDIPTFRVRRKMIAIMADDEATASIKASVDEQQSLVKADPQAYSFAPYVGRHGWVLCQLPKTPLAVLEELLTEAWRATAPKRLVRAWDEHGRQGGS